MKNLFNFIFAISIVLLGSCTFNGQDGAPGPRGPQGPAGQDGQDGMDGQEAYVFEYVDITFSATNEYSVILEIPETFNMLESDKVLVYFLYDYLEQDDLDVWRALPQTEFTDHGTLIYNYDFTMFDVALFLDSDFDLNLLGANFTDNWIARVVVVPGQFQNGRTESSVDYKDYNAVMEHYNLSDQSIVTVK
ncbi:collagen-like protein [Marivirga salinae]|uniref:Collagen-like protein n=1 Tax=Marivirga salinarum TaxID=3059078 RepID=A0AA51NC19_9BACT|nr:collagen-like protein [Marivirga sp. BDSF4-3]WMN12368.1 collagen-like protein [Marivirga sp. BDSF4-3]